jgi:hypothetical protein
MTIEAVVIGGDGVEMGRRWTGVGPYSQQPNNIFFLLVNPRVQRVKIGRLFYAAYCLSYFTRQRELVIKSFIIKLPS